MGDNCTNTFKKINYQSDFKLHEVAKEGSSFDVPYCYHYFTQRGRVYEASWNGKEYKNCRKLADGSILVIFDDHNLHYGRLMVKRRYNLTDADFADGMMDLVTEEKTDVELITGPSDQTSADITVYPNYQKGDKGDDGKDLTWDTMTDAEKQEVVEHVTDNIEGLVVYPTYKLTGEMHLTMESQCPTQRVRLNEENGHLNIKVPGECVTNI